MEGINYILISKGKARELLKSNKGKEIYISQGFSCQEEKCDLYNSLNMQHFLRNNILFDMDISDSEIHLKGFVSSDFDIDINKLIL